MKVKVPLLLVLALAVVIGYMLGTEAGRKQRDIILAKMGSGPESDGAGEPAAGDGSADADASAEAPAS